MPNIDLDFKQRRLNSFRRAIVGCWMVTTFAVLGTVAWAGLRIRSNVNDLLLPGPARQKMMSDLQDRVARSLGPRLKSDAGRAFRDLQPILRAKAEAVDKQAPSAAGAAMDTLALFRDDLPGALIKPLDDRLTEELKAQRQQLASHTSGKSEAEIEDESRKVFDAVHAEFVRALAPIVRPYQQQVTQILGSVTAIRNQEAPNIRGIGPTWDMDLMVLEEMHREVAALRSLTEGPAK
jgi:hypothetical protein